MKKIKLLVFSLIAFLCFGVTNVYASSAIDTLLTNGKLVIKSIAPTNENEATSILEDIFLNSELTGLSADTFNEDFTSCTIHYPALGQEEETQVVDIDYVFDSNIKSKVDTYLVGLTKNEFLLTDLELINYWLNAGEETSPVTYSGEFKKAINSKNFSIDVRAGGGADFTDGGFGVAKFVYNNTTYALRTSFGAYIENAIYIPSNTTDANALEVAKARIDNYVGNEDINLTYVGTISNYITNYLAEQQEAGYYEYAYSSYNNQNGELYFLHNAVEGKYYKITINNEDHLIIIIKDDDKMTNPTYLTSDINSDISISSSDSSVPLDTLIKVKEMTSGEEYTRIINILNATNSEMFDLSLFSKSLGNYLEDGSFEVRIPISEAYKGKTLKVFYVDNNGNKKEYTVTIDGDYAVFNTDHFSIYTLVATDTSSEKNPTTSDRIISSILLGSISLIGIAGCGIFLKKKLFN